MAKNLVIVESPSKANTIKKYLGSKYMIDASMGHLRDLPKSQLGVDIENNFQPKYISIRGKGQLISKLKKEAQRADKVYLATDPDREGEAISWHLAQLLGLDEKDAIRVTFNEITKTAVTEGIKNPRTIDKDLVDAQQARRVLDRIVGYKISPILWRKVKKGLSAGRVQSVATRLIVDREREITDFIPKEYWNIDAELLSDKSKKSYKAKFHGDKKGKIEVKNADQANKILNDLKDVNFVVKSIKNADKQKRPSPPFITSTLQQEASYKLGFQPRKTMLIAQELYEGVNVEGHGAVGLITYMRTDSLRISNEARDLAKDIIVEKFGEDFYPKTPRVYKSKKDSQDAHEAIRPTYIDITPSKIKDTVSKDQYKLYKLIWEKFISSQMENAVYETKAADIEAGKYIFKAAGSRIKFQGYRAVYVDFDDNEENEQKGKKSPDTLLPDLLEGEIQKLAEMNSEQLFTQPPSRYNEATLIKALEENGIGRPSTYAPTVTTIIARGYVVRVEKQLAPTILGEITTDLMKEYFKDIVDVTFTANMEKQLDEVEDGNVEWTDVLKNFYGDFSKSIDIAQEQIGDLNVKIPDEESDVVCENCGRKMVFKMSKYGKFLACPGFPECRNTKPIVEKTDVPCPKCGGEILLKKSKSNKKYFGCENSPKCDFMSWDEPIKEKCPNCGSLLLKKVKWGKKIYCYNTECGYERESK